MNIPKFLLLLLVALSITLVSIFTIQLLNHIRSVNSSDEISAVPRVSQEDTHINDDGVIAPERQSQTPHDYQVTLKTASLSTTWMNPQWMLVMQFLTKTKL